MKILRIGFAIWLFAVGMAAAQQVQQGIIVTGQGRVASEPDMATISLGVRQMAPTAKGVMDEVSRKVAGLLSELDAAGVAKKDRQTSGFFLRPVYKKDYNDGEISQYEAGNSVHVQVRELRELGNILDAVIEVGANDFNGLTFGLQDSSAAMARARAQAVKDAKARAEQLAEAAGVQLGAILHISEAGQGVHPQAMASMARGAMAESIATGEVDVTAQVTIVFDITPAQ